MFAPRVGRSTRAVLLYSLTGLPSTKRRLARVDATWPASTVTVCYRLPPRMFPGGRRVTEPRRLKSHVLGSFLTRGIRRSARLSLAERFDSAGGKKLRAGVPVQKKSESKRMTGVVIEGPRLNPLDSVGPDLMRSIFSALNEDDLACCAVVSKEVRLCTPAHVNVSFTSHSR